MYRVLGHLLRKLRGILITENIISSLASWFAALRKYPEHFIRYCQYCGMIRMTGNSYIVKEISSTEQWFGQIMCYHKVGIEQYLVRHRFITQQDVAVKYHQSEGCCYTDQPEYVPHLGALVHAL